MTGAPTDMRGRTLLRRPSVLSRLVAVAVSTAALLPGCSHTGKLHYVAATIAPVPKDTTVRDMTGRTRVIQTWRPMFSDTLIGLVPGSGDTTRRYLGRLRDGYTADTLNIMLFGDNRPGWRSTRLQAQYATLHGLFSPSPARIFKGLYTIPIAIWKGLYPDLALIRDIPGKLTNRPTWGRERQVMSAMLAKIDSLHSHGQFVAAVINSGDLVDDGRSAQQWERFLKLASPLTTRVPYFPVAGNHERVDTELGIGNWREATGLPVSSDRLYYCFDSADGWVRFIALDSNPIVDPGAHWTREVQVKYSDEEFSWLVARVKEHTGPVIVMMHHPPFSIGFHRDEWQRDPVLRERRERMVKALHEAGIAIIASGHEHTYERALLRWKDAVLIAIVTGGGGAPLHDIPTAPQAAQLFSQYHVAGSTVKPEDVFTEKAFHFIHLRLWFGGGELFTYAVDNQSKVKLIDRVAVDLTRYGVPKVDQHKVPLPPAKGPSEPPHAGTLHEQEMKGAKIDTLTASKRLLSKPPPGRKRRR